MLNKALQIERNQKRSFSYTFPRKVRNRNFFWRLICNFDLFSMKIKVRFEDLFFLTIYSPRKYTIHSWKDFHQRLQIRLQQIVKRIEKLSEVRVAI